MFERTNRAAGALHVEITLADGRKLKGKIVAQQDRSLPEVLNSPTPFVEFELADRTANFCSEVNPADRYTGKRRSAAEAPSSSRYYLGPLCPPGCDSRRHS